MPLSQPQKAVANSKKRFRTAIFGRRAGKTTLAIREMLRFASKPNQNVWYVSPTYRMSKEIVSDRLRRMLTDLRWLVKYNESNLTAYLKNGSIITLKGSENFDSLRGRSINFLVLDEIADIKPAAFYEVLRPSLADTNGHALFCGTPKGKSNWSYDLFNMPQVDSNWGSWQTTTLEGGFVTPDEVEEAKKLLDTRTFDAEFNATFVNAGNKIFYNFDRDRNVQPWTLEVPKMLHIANDFNYSPMTCVIAVKGDNNIHIIDEIKMNTSNTDEMVDEIKERYPRHKIFSFPDPAGRQNKSSAAGRTDIGILENAGFIVKAPRKHTPVRDTINSVNSLLLNANGDVRLTIDPRCKNTIESMDRWNYKEGTSQPDKDQGWDHFADTVRYLIDGTFPLTKHIEPQAPMRWGHKIRS
tara:strand:+ start:3451 stop:4683 length:1233 start_codon:yes stop_codon:yes gene_type:complete